MRTLVSAMALALGLLLFTGCEQADTIPPVTTRAGSYVLRATSSTNTANAFWGAHVARAGDTFFATIGSDGRLTINGLRVSGYNTPGIALTATSTGYTGSQNHTLNAVGDPAFFTSVGYTVADTVALADATPLNGTIASTATRASTAGTLQDTLAFSLEARPDLSATGAGRYRLTVETTGGTLPSASPQGATADLLLASDGTVTLNLDQAGSDETVPTWFSTAATLSGQYSIFDDTSLGNNLSIPLTLTLSGGGAARAVTAASWSLQRNSSPITTEEQYTLTAKPLTFFQAFASPLSNGIYELYAGTRTATNTIPGDWLTFVDRIVAATDVGQTVTADLLQTQSGGVLTDIELRLDTQGTIGALDGSDTRLPIGQRTAGGTKLVNAFQRTTAVADGSIHQGLLTTLTFEFTYSGASTFGIANGRITFVSSGGTGTVDFSFNPTE